MSTEAIDRRPEWVSDHVVDLLRDMELEYVALNPGASYRGLHDSLVNYADARGPQIITSLHEEHAVAIAHGYAKVTGRPMAVALHANVGLMHASMAIYNAWCDRVPMMIIGATGPVDAARRRPWIDWIHTTADQAALVRPFIKWDDQPASLEAATESLLRANVLTRSYPSGPVYVCLDAAMQETVISRALTDADPRRYQTRPAAQPGDEAATAAHALQRAQRPVLMIGRVSRSEDDWAARVRLAEAIGANVVTDLNCGASFPTDHPLHVASCQMLRDPRAQEAIRDADVVFALDWVDLGGNLRQVLGTEPAATVIVCGNDEALWNGWSKDHGGFAPTDISLPCEPGAGVSAVLKALEQAGTPTTQQDPPAFVPPSVPRHAHSTGRLVLEDIAEALTRVAPAERTSYVRLPLNWQGDWLTFRHPLDFIGYDGGAAIGSGPGMAIGSALAMRESGRLPIAVLGDGDTSMGITALWSAARYRIPLLIIVANNQTYGNDELHQVRVAHDRGRPAENAWVGQRMTDPEIDYSLLAKAQGFEVHPVITQPAQLQTTLARAIQQVDEGACVLIDVRIANEPT